jgi:hypothetical protein
MQSLDFRSKLELGELEFKSKEKLQNIDQLRSQAIKKIKDAVCTATVALSKLDSSKQQRSLLKPNNQHKTGS